MSAPAETVTSPPGRWLWLFPLAYGLHIAEEHWFQFPAWVVGLGGPFVSVSQSLFLNAVLWLAMGAAVIFIRTRPSLAWLVVSLATILGINAALHLVGSAVTSSYSPGSVTAAILYIPLAVFSVRRVVPAIGRGPAIWAALAGAAIHAAVMIVAAHPSLLPAI